MLQESTFNDDAKFHSARANRVQLNVFSVNHPAQIVPLSVPKASQKVTQPPDRESPLRIKSAKVPDRRTSPEVFLNFKQGKKL